MNFLHTSVTDFFSLHISSKQNAASISLSSLRRIHNRDMILPIYSMPV